MVPWWPVSGRLQPPAAQQPSPPVPPGRRCGGGCSHWSWRRQGGPCAAEAAGRCLFSPSETRCAGVSGPPGGGVHVDVEDGEVEKGKQEEKAYY